jgi:carboxymethylenebutenolidase
MRVDRVGLVVSVAAAAMLTVTRVPSIAASTSLSVGVKQNMEATLFAPDGAGPYPGVLVLHADGAVRPADLSFASRLADQGFVCLVPAFMKAYGLTNQTRQTAFTADAEPIYADLVSALGMLQHLDKVRGSKVGVVGFAGGGYFAMWLAATSKVEAAVAYYGDFAGAHMDKSLARFRALFTSSSAPVLILHGTGDLTAPADVAQQLASILQAVHAPHDIELYPGADHEFDRSASAADFSAANFAWERTVAFLAGLLK